MVSLKTVCFKYRTDAEKGITLRQQKTPWNKYKIIYGKVRGKWRYIIRWVSSEMQCPECGKWFLQKRSSQVYCHGGCGDNIKYRKYNAKRRGDAEYNEYNKKYCKEWRDRKRDEGFCTRCGGINDGEGSLCSKCLIETTK